MKDLFLVIGGAVLGFLLISSALKGLVSVVIGREDPPRRYQDYASAAIRGRNPFKGPGKHLLLILGGWISTVLLWVLFRPQKIALWQFKRTATMEKHPKLRLFISHIIGTMVVLLIDRYPELD